MVMGLSNRIRGFSARRAQLAENSDHPAVAHGLSANRNYPETGFEDINADFAEEDFWIAATSARSTDISHTE
jgi:hypothetical protein